MATKEERTSDPCPDSESDAPEEESFSSGKKAATKVSKAISELKSRRRAERLAQHRKNYAQKEAKRQQQLSSLSDSRLPLELLGSLDGEEAVQPVETLPAHNKEKKRHRRPKVTEKVCGRSILQVKLSSERRKLPPSSRFAFQGSRPRRETVASFLGKLQKQAIQRVNGSCLL
ncbi:uncharacterized protein LOC135369281 [Ornithodoros turicata]|uniref:uncharacterized protein LOC135369281 n=1 Tax=Ornithodoros turicata TaxID=34597 RepID=UPI003139B769